MTAQIQQLTPELTLERINEIPVLTINHPVGAARIALQGAQLLNWQPKGAEQDIFWLSEIDLSHKVWQFAAVYRFVTLGLEALNNLHTVQRVYVCGN